MMMDQAVEWMKQMVIVAGIITGPLLAVALVVGIVVGIIQAATQIQEMTLTFLPKVLAVALVLVLAGPWFLHLLVQFVHGAFAQAGTL